MLGRRHYVYLALLLILPSAVANTAARSEGVLGAVAAFVGVSIYVVVGIGLFEIGRYLLNLLVPPNPDEPPPSAHP